jgi:hypothetical protein
VATHAGTVAKGWLEIETGFERDDFATGHAVGIPTVLKIGIAKQAQLSVQLPASTPLGSSLGIGDFAVGVKWRLADALPVLGDFAILPMIKLPTGSFDGGRGTSTTDLSLLLISSHALGDVALDINAGITCRSGDGTDAPRTATLWTVSFGFPILRQLGWVAEVFGFPETSGPAGAAGTVAFLTGPTLVVKPWLALDLGLIRRIDGPQPNAIYGGVTWNLGRLWSPAHRTASTSRATASSPSLLASSASSSRSRPLGARLP